MKRILFDKIVTLVGFGIGIFLLLAAGLLNWGATFAADAVNAQLEVQQITLPQVTGNKAESADVTKFFQDNGKKIMTTEKQAQMYADHYIGFHLSAMPTYASAATAARVASKALAANPTDATLQASANAKAAVVETVFRGNMLRATLLTAYAFGTLGIIAGISAIAAFVGGALLLLLCLVGLFKIRRTPSEATI